MRIRQAGRRTWRANSRCSDGAVIGARCYAHARSPGRGQEGPGVGPAPRQLSLGQHPRRGAGVAVFQQILATTVSVPGLPGLGASPGLVLTTTSCTVSPESLRGAASPRGIHATPSEMSARRRASLRPPPDRSGRDERKASSSHSAFARQGLPAGTRALAAPGTTPREGQTPPGAALLRVTIG